MSSMHQAVPPQLRERLEKLRADVLERAAGVHRDLTRQSGALSADLREQAVEVQNDATLAAIGAAAGIELDEINEALRRIDQGTYGLCRDCGRAISSLRLAALPQAVTCSACAR